MNGPNYYISEGKRLFGFMHSSQTKSKKNIGIIICSPHAEEKLNSHRVLYNLANDLSSAGYDCLRFDYYGHGDSEGEFRDTTIKTMTNDILASVNLFSDNDYSSLCLLGYRFGATIATLAAVHDDRIKNIILINPIIDIAKYINECLRGNLSSQVMLHNKVIKNTKELLKDIENGEEVNYYGYEMTKQFVDEALSIKLRESFKKLNCSILHIEIKRGRKKTKQNTSPIEHQKLIYRELPGIQCWTGAKFYKVKDDIVTEEIVSWMDD